MMKKFIFSILIALALAVSSCGPSRHTQGTSDNAYGYSLMEYAMDKVLGRSQVDSMITVDNLQTLDKWILSGFGSRTQYVFIKSLGANELIYTATTTPVDTLYKCTKRITKTIVDE